MRRYAVILVTVLLTLVQGLTIAGPAQAGVKFTFNAGPEPVKKGGYVTLSGIAGGATGLSEVDLYFRADGTSRWVFQSSTKISSNGRYSRRQAQNHSGTWKAQYWRWEDDLAATRTDHVKMRGVQLPGVVTGYGGYYVTFKPSSFDPSTTTAWWFTGVRWTKLTSSRGEATGTLHYNTCEPSCADGKTVTKRVNLEFRRVRMHHGAPAFTEFSYDNDDYWTPLTPAA